MKGIRRNILMGSIEHSTLMFNRNRTVATKVKSHYETLGIPQNATFNEIKTAYYKLTLKYHPDKNDSEQAKQRFHEISSAYDVLSRYESRKRYDKTLLPKSKNVTATKHSSTFTSNVQHNNMKSIYNFDEWMRMHYIIAFENSVEQKKVKEKLKDEQQSASSFNVVLTTILILFFLLAGIRIKYDRSESEKKRHKP